MWAITHIVFASLHFVPGAHGGWARGPNFPRFAAEERAAITLPFEGYWERVS